MEIRKFRKAYDLELIPASHEGIQLGDLVWDPLLGPPVFQRKDMPNSIFTAFLDAGLLEEGEWAGYQKAFRDSPLMEAQLASRNVDVDVELVAELKHPEIAKMQGEFLAEKLSKFTFGSLKVRVMEDVLRVRIDHYLEQMKASHWSLYEGSIRRVHMITELYYGSIRLVVSSEHSAELDSLLSQTTLQATARTEGSHAIAYEFSHANVPFAMRLERIRTFNG